MKSRRSASVFHPRFRRSGTALVIVLAFVVLLVVMVLAYFSYSTLQSQISQASVNQAAVEVFARGAANTVIGDLRQEILAGSTNLSTNGAQYQALYPTSPSTAVPALSGFTANTGLENLVKVSRMGSTTFPANSNYNAASYPPANRAANVSSTNASRNGRFVPPASWNAHLLLAKANLNSATDLTPTNSFNAPDWILVARDGSNPTAWNTNLCWNPTNASTVLGRYAYAIYDEGGLLDLNAAGYPPGSSTNLVAEKGNLALADLTAIPGLTTNVVAAIVGWRNYASGGATGNFPAYTFTDTARTNYFDFVRTNATGFLRSANNALSNGQSDHLFTSRQQLIQFLTSSIASNEVEKAALQNSLRYLGTFSRDLEQPSFRPDPSRPKNTTKQLRNTTVGGAGGVASGYGGNDAYQQQDQINPALLAVRDTNGQPVMKRRFPLSRLRFVIANPSADTDKIKKYFGLVWDSTNCRWIYTSPDGNTTASTIKTLDQVALANREPDFFETLKAAINCDSLGKQHGGNEASQESPHSFLSNMAAIDGRIDYQIMQIGAALIDQYDEDSYPTRIVFDSNAAASYPREFYGVENIPTFMGFMTSWYRLEQLTSADIQSDPGYQPPNGVMPYETAVFLQPILWNSHAPDPRANPPGLPTNFQIQAGDPTTATAQISIYPQVKSGWWPGISLGSNGKAKLTHTYPASAASPLTPDSYAESYIGPISENPNTYIRFNASPGTFLEPYRLHAPNDPPGSATTASTILDTADLEEGTFAQALGIYVGKCWTGPASGVSPIDNDKCLIDGTLSANLRIHLQYKNPYQASPAYLTYDVISDAYLTSSSQFSTVASDDGTNTIRGMRTGLRADPRTDRWGLATINMCPFWDGRFARWNGVGTVPGWQGSYRNTPIFYLPQNLTLEAGTGTMFTASGAPNVQTALAPGWMRPGDQRQRLGDLQLNSFTPDNGTNPDLPGNKLYYADADGVIRRASGAYYSGTAGLPLATGNFDSRPVILNRPFRSVAEMGYAFRGVAWKDIDFFTPESGDAALLDAFCINEVERAPDNVTVAGRVTLNTRQSKVLQAVIQGVSKAEGGVISSAEAQAAAEALVNWTSDTTNFISGVPSRGPLRNRAELVGKWVAGQTFTLPPAGGNANTPLQTIYDGKTSYSGFSSLLSAGGGIFSSAADASIKRRRECVMRALADAGNTRTWNLLIDLVGQVGRYPAQSISLSQFAVSGETHIWIHLALDRATGKIVAEQVEPVSE